MGSEYARQREHMERSVASLRKKLAKDTEIHRKENIRVMHVCNITRQCYTSKDLSSIHTGKCLTIERDQRSSCRIEENTYKCP